MQNDVTILRPKTHEEWLEARKQGIGSSEAGTIIGVNPYETPLQLWLRKTGQTPSKTETFLMKAGHYLEQAVTQFWQDATGHTVIKSSAGDWIVYDKKRPYLRVSPDRTYWPSGAVHNQANRGILECKTTQRTIDPDDLPKTWFCQLQYQLGVAGLQYGSLAWLTAGREFGYKDIAFVPEFYDWMTEQIERFWTVNVQGGVEPEPMNASDILLKFATPESGKVLEVSEEIAMLCQELHAVKDELAAVDERKKELEDKIKLNFSDAEAISYRGQTLATWKAPAPTAKFDTKAFSADHPDMAKQYTTMAAGSRRFLLK